MPSINVLIKNPKEFIKWKYFKKEGIPTVYYAG
jgi:hypothetical protein